MRRVRKTGRKDRSVTASELPKFTDKVLAVYLIGREGVVTNIIRNVHMEEQAGRFFLVGETVENPNQPQPFAGLRNAVAWDQVAEYIVLDSVEDLYHRLNIKPGRKAWFG
jgi:hypothetical protein